MHRFISFLLLKLVAPFAGAWIEITFAFDLMYDHPVAPFAGAWIEIGVRDYFTRIIDVAPFAGAWIEISPCLHQS